MTAPPQLASALRQRPLGNAPVNASGRFVLYWMTVQRRLAWNLALDHALALAKTHNVPVLVLEPLRAAYPHASRRFHQFVLEGMAENAKRAADAGLRYYPYVEPEADAGKGLLAALSDHAVAIVADGYPTFHTPAMLRAAAKQVSCAMVAIDGCGWLPMQASEKAPATAYAFRRFLHRVFRDHLDEAPLAEPLRHVDTEHRAVIPREILGRWPMAPQGLLDCEERALDALPIDHDVGPASMRGGSAVAEAMLASFVAHDLPGYAERRRDPVEGGTSELSPYLHFGHVGSHQVVRAVMEAEGWTRERLATTTKGQRAGWWGMSEGAEAFLDQVITWRELGHHFAWHRRDHARYASLPAWARASLEAHGSDEREPRYTPKTFERAETYDEIWNAAQRQLVCEGRMHNYLRMLWGKKILEWARTPQEAARIMVHLNDKYAVDGRDPNSYSGIYWVLGRHDRPWAPERKVFGVIRYMSSDSTRRKLRLGQYLERYGDHAQSTLFTEDA